MKIKKKSDGRLVKYTRGIIDYSVTFIKRGQAIYYSKHKEIYHIIKTDFLALILNRNMAIFSDIYNIKYIIN